MAGRPATGGSTTGLLVGMCVSIGVAVIALVMLVVLWTNQEDLRAETDRANQDARRYMSSGEASGAYRSWLDGASGGKTVAGLMGQELTQFGELVAGDQTPQQPKAVELIRDGALTAVFDRIAADESIEDSTQVVDQPLITALEAMYDLYATEHESKSAAQGQIAELNRQIEALAAEKQQIAESFDTKAAELGEQVASIESDRETYYQEKEDQFREIEESNTARVEEARLQQESLQSRLQEIDGQLVKSEEAKRQMQQKLRAFQFQPKQGGSARFADATVVRAMPGSKHVYIDLGRQDNLILGMRFAIYPPARNLPRSGRAKAAVEVIDISEDVTTCRVEWDDVTNPILKGDVAANPIYDRDRQLVFLVIGQFDLNHDGLDDTYGREMIEAVVTDFNGEITDTLSARVDFVVVGARPLLPTLPRDADEAAAIRAEYDNNAGNYQQIFEDAKALSVPMLTQDTFLNFLGRR